MFSDNILMIKASSGTRNVQFVLRVELQEGCRVVKILKAGHLMMT